MTLRRGDLKVSECWVQISGLPKVSGHWTRDKACAEYNFLAGIIKRVRPTTPYLSDMRREPPGASTERRRWKALPVAF
jgi:hypothetical protein